MKKCIICNEREAVVPDRKQASKEKMICRQCHGERLLNDLHEIVKLHNKTRRRQA